MGAIEKSLKKMNVSVIMLYAAFYLSVAHHRVTLSNRALNAYSICRCRPKITENMQSVVCAAWPGRLRCKFVEKVMHEGVTD